MLRYLLKLFLMLFTGISVFTQPLSGQSILSQASQFNFYESPDYAGHRFEKLLNTYSLRSSLFYKTSIGDFSIGINESFNSTIVKSHTNNIKDENRLSILGEYKISPLLAAGILINNKMYVDDRSLALNNAFSLQSSVFGKIYPAENISFVAFGGYSTNRQIGEEDLGFIYGSEMLVNHLMLEDFDLFSTLKFQNEDISPRRNLLRQANLEISNTLEDRINNKFTFYYFQDSKDFYFAADSITAATYSINNNIQNRDERQYHFEDRLQYDPGISGLSFDMQARLSWRDIKKKNRYATSLVTNSAYFDTKIEEFKINFDLHSKYNAGSFNGIFRINFYEQEERYAALENEEISDFIFEERSELEKRKNNKSQVVSLSMLGNIELSKSDLLSFSAYHRKLKYDTSSDQNFDDRDELLSLFRIMYHRKLSPLLNLYVNLETSFNHIVYIFAERSSNNNRRRIIKLVTGANYKGKSFSSRNSFEVSANYTTYDFEDLNPNYQSFAFRQFAARDSTNLKLTRKTRVTLLGTVKLSEQGDFNWTDFSSRPIRYQSEIHLEPKFFYRISKIDLGLGVRFFELSTYNYSDSDWNLQTRYRSIGPLCEIMLYAVPQLSFKFLGWYEFIYRKNAASQQMANLNLELYWLL